jgi:hypothetical protein
MADLKVELGSHPVKVRDVRVTEEDGGFVSIGIQVEFQNGEKGWKYVNNKTDKGLLIMRKTLKSIGFDPDKNDIAFLVKDEKALWDNECEAVVGENDWNGRITNRIDWINPLRKKPDAAKLSGLTDALRGIKSKDEPLVVPDNQDGAL